MFANVGWLIVNKRMNESKQEALRGELADLPMADKTCSAWRAWIAHGGKPEHRINAPS